MKYFAFPILLFLFACGKQNNTSSENTDNSDETSEIKSDVKLLLEDGYNVAFLIMDGTYNTELTAPMDIFHHTKFRDSIDALNVFTIAKSKESIKTFEELLITPDYSYNETYPDIDILVIPSAQGHLNKDLEDEEMIGFVQKTAEDAVYVTSHCDGAFVLAEAGLLDGINCTTFPGDIETMRERYSEPIIHDDVLFVHEGKFITSAGGAKSFEASLYLVELLFGKENADEIAEGMVIDWDLDQVPHMVIKKGGDQ